MSIYPCILPSLTLDRPKLGTDIFSNPETRLAINRCTHPAVYREIGVQVAHAYFRGSRLVVVDIPLLFETRAHLHPAFSTTPVAVVAVPRDVQKARLMSRDGLTDTITESRIESQMSTVDKVMLGEAVIENDGTVEDTEAKVDRLIHEVLRGNRIPPNPARVALLAGVSKSCCRHHSQDVAHHEVDAVELGAVRRVAWQATRLALWDDGWIA